MQRPGDAATVVTYSKGLQWSMQAADVLAKEGIDIEAQWDGIVDRTPLGRLCEPDEIGRAVVFLASEMASFVTGVLVPVDGGILIQPLEGYVPPEEAA